MNYEDTVAMSEEQFRRLTGVKRTVFEKMLFLLRAALQIKKQRGGRPNKLSVKTRCL
jgi:hypothetical protein